MNAAARSPSLGGDLRVRGGVVGAPPGEVNEGDRCGIARRLGMSVPCPEGGCALLLALRHAAHDVDCGCDGACPSQRVSTPVGFDPEVVSSVVRVLGYQPDDASSGMCPVEAIAHRAGFDPVVLRTLDEVRRELDRVGLSQSTARATRTRPHRHEAALERWPVEP